MTRRRLSVYLTNVWNILHVDVCDILQLAASQADIESQNVAYLVLFNAAMKSSLRFSLLLAATAVLCFLQTATAEHAVQAGPSVMTVPDAGSTASLLGLALLGVAALRSKLRR